MIHVVARIEVREGQRQAFLEEFLKIMPMVWKEPGCHDYFPTVDVDSGIGMAAPTNPNAVTILERWESAEALQAHVGTPHVMEFLGKVQDLVVNLDIRVVEPVEHAG